MTIKTDNSAWNDELLRDPHAVADKRRRVQSMFAAIAPSYDLNNRLHSLWMDQRWRRKAVKLANLKATDRVVDVACGTGDLAIAFVDRLMRLSKAHRHARYTRAEVQHWSVSKEELPNKVLAVDFTYEMLPIAKKKGPSFHIRWVSEATLWDGWGKMILWLNGDAQSLPLADQSADVVSIAFGIRNVQDPLAAMREFRRILRPGGRLIVLEFSLPTNPILRGLYNFYFRQVLPRTATLISGDKTGAYKYLPQSVNTFIGREQMVEMMKTAGFSGVEQFPLTFGVCVCYRGYVA